MGVSTRPTQQRHQAEASLRSILMALFILACPQAEAAPQQPTTAAAPQPPSEFSTTLPASTTFALVQPGQEKIELSARFTEKSRNYADSLDWKIKTPDGETLFEGSAPIVSVKLKPGAYEVIGHYGNVVIDEGLSLPSGTQLSVNFVLNAGALRVLPRLPQGLAATDSVNTKVYALNGDTAGRLVASDVRPGAMLKLAAGTYRIETRLPSGNVAAVTDITVKAGLLRAIDIAHHAGLAKLSLDRKQQAQWLVMESGGAVLPLPAGPEASALLKPGHYVAEARSGGKVMQKSFTITEGEMSAVILTAP
jgi:hypothetical protein